MGARRLAKRKRAEMEEAENQRAMGMLRDGGRDREQGPNGYGFGYSGPDGRDGLGEDGPRVKRSRDVGMVVTHCACFFFFFFLRDDARESYLCATDNARPEVGLVQRRESPIIGLRNFNNWIKSVLITKFAHPALSPPNGKGKVLDMGCGKGGDLAKWSKARVREYVGLGTHTPPLFALTHSPTSHSDTSTTPPRHRRHLNRPSPHPFRIPPPPLRRLLPRPRLLLLPSLLLRTLPTPRHAVRCRQYAVLYALCV